MSQYRPTEDMREKTDRLIGWSKVEVLLSVAVACIAIGGAVGSWYVLPYRVGQTEAAIVDLRHEIKGVREENSRNQELLIRMDERIKTIQRALKIPSEP